jgi:hypothetical protein
MSARQSGISKDVLLTTITRSPDPEQSYGIITRAYEAMLWSDPRIKEMVVIDFAGREELACLDAAGL